MSGFDEKGFEAKVASLIAATRHLDVPQILTLRRLTMRDPETRKWATDRQLEVVFSVILTKAAERMGLEALRASRERHFDNLLPPSQDMDRVEDVRALHELALQLLGPQQRTEAEIAQADFQAILSRGIGGDAPRRTERARPSSKEPAPLFAAQVEAAPTPLAKAAPAPSQEPAEEEEAPFVDFNTMFDDTLCTYTRKTLTLMAVADTGKGGRPPFLIAPAFHEIYTQVLRKFILPGMRASRHIQTLSTNYNWADVGGAKLIEIVQGSEINNPVLHNWDSQWNGLKGTKPAKPAPAAKGKKPAPPAPTPWSMFAEHAKANDYAAPEEDDLGLLRDLLRFDAQAIAKAWKEIGQLYNQEFHMNAREGALRDGIVKWVPRLQEHVGEHLAIKAYFEFPKLEPSYMRRLINNFGRSDSDRRRAAPHLVDFVAELGG